VVQEWGISNTTLEEVFLRLVAANNSLNAVDLTDDTAVDSMAPSQQLLQALKWAELEHLEPILAQRNVTFRELMRAG
jgi:hypothetical protein